MADAQKLMQMIAETTASGAWKEAERMQRELESRYASMGLGRSTSLLEASLENYMRPARQVAESLSREYENVYKSLGGEALRQDIERLVTQQATIAEERLKHDAELTGLGYRAIQPQMDSQRDHLVSSFVQALEIAEERRKRVVAESWPTHGPEPEDADRAELTDALCSRRAFRRDLPLATIFAENHGVPLSAIMIDIDNFKGINDSLGHPVGDQVLLAVASTVHSVVGTKGRSYRYGGDEFIVLLPNTTGDEALALGTRLRDNVATSGSRPIPTISVGIAVFQPGSDPATLVESADAALREAKQQGKNQVVLAARLRPEG